VLYTADISRSGFFTIVSNSFRQDLFSIVAATLYALCAYGKA
jgi:hypothetical protein